VKESKTGFTLRRCFPVRDAFFDTALKNRQVLLQHPGGSDPVTANIGQGVFKFLVDVVGHAFDGIIHTANPAVKQNTASGAADSKWAATLAANHLGCIHIKPASMKNDVVKSISPHNGVAGGIAALLTF